MRRAVAALAIAALLCPLRARAEGASDAAVIRGCLTAAAQAHRLPPAILVVLLGVEGGSLGRVSRNTNATVDIGPMQVNQIWIPEIAAHWATTPERTFLALRDSFCANLEAGAWILRRGLDEAHGDFWEGVGDYHSHDPAYKQSYLRAVLRQVTLLRSAPPQPATYAVPAASHAPVSEARR